MRTAALLLDLDETLLVEDASVEAAFLTTAESAGPDLDAARLALDARRHARALWWACDLWAEGRRIGVSSWEVLGGALDDGTPERRAFTEDLVRRAWLGALREQRVDDVGLAERLAALYPEERDARHVLFDDALPALESLREAGLRLAIVTNGAPRTQRRKVEAAALLDRVDVVVVSGDVGAAKPGVEPFRTALRQLGVSASRAAMVGDSLEKDVGGAMAAGVRGIWLNRHGRANETDVEPDAVVAGLDEILGALV